MRNASLNTFHFFAFRDCFRVFHNKRIAGLIIQLTENEKLFRKLCSHCIISIHRSLFRTVSSDRHLQPPLCVKPQMWHLTLLPADFIFTMWVMWRERYDKYIKFPEILEKFEECFKFFIEIPVCFGEELRKCLISCERKFWKNYMRKLCQIFERS